MKERREYQTAGFSKTKKEKKKGKIRKENKKAVNHHPPQDYQIYDIENTPFQA